jgi:hypothetical protein
MSTIRILAGLFIANIAVGCSGASEPVSPENADPADLRPAMPLQPPPPPSRNAAGAAPERLAAPSAASPFIEGTVCSGSPCNRVPSHGFVDRFDGIFYTPNNWVWVGGWNGSNSGWIWGSWVFAPDTGNSGGFVTGTVGASTCGQYMQIEALDDASGLWAPPWGYIPPC